MSPSLAGYCPACEHLLADGDVVKIVGRHMDGVDPSFRCPDCDGEITHPSRAPESAAVYESTTPDTRESEHTTAGNSRDDSGYDDATTTVVDAVPPLDVTAVRAGDRITVHYDAPGRAALQTAAGTVTDPDTPGGVAFETDTRRVRRLDPATGMLSTPDDRLGVASKVRVSR
jgi:hypothetical protein